MEKLDERITQLGEDLKELFEGFVKTYKAEIPELSDEEIFDEAKKQALEELITSVDSFVDGAKWYREQIKNQQQ